MKFIPVAEPVFEGNELKYVTDCITNGWISSQGDYVKRFESEFASFCNCKHGVSTSNGTTALHLALAALGIGEGDEVIVPNLTFVATANVVKHAGATPVFVDSDEETWNMNPEKIEEKITERTKAIIPVHLYGHPCDMDKIMDIARRHNLFVVEDAAEAHGAEYNGKKVGSIGHVGCFSFFGNKIITTGEGGMCVTSDENLASKMRVLRDHGMKKGRPYWVEVVGYNYRMTNLQAAVGLAQLERIGAFINKKAENAAHYNRLLRNVKGVHLQKIAPWAKNVYWMYSILLDESYGLSRDQLIDKLKWNGIDSRPFFYPISEMPPYNDKRTFPVSKRLSLAGINLPSSTNLSGADIERIAEVIKNHS